VPKTLPTVEFTVTRPVIAVARPAKEEEEPAETSAPPREPAAPAVFTPGEFLGAPFVPGTLEQRTWYAGETFYGSAIPTPVLVATGEQPGKTLCLTAAVHGDELNGIETVRQVMHQLEPKKLTGTVIGVPIVNLQGFQRHSRYLPDRRDLNRFFPGNQQGSSAARMAFSFFREVIMHCDGLVDLHTGSFHRTNLPQLRADLNDDSVVALTKGFGSTVILHSEGAEGTLRHAAVAAGIPAVTLEAGEPLRVDDEHVDHAVKGIFTLLDTMGMYNRRSLWGNPEPVYYTATWLRSDVGGILSSRVKLGRKVRAGDLLGTVTDPITNEQSDVHSPHDGRIIGMALNQFVMPGFAVYHVGLEAPVDEASQETDALEVDHTVAQVEVIDEH
jgi:predicted deacylase